jgi:SAM-dependent methyltransferase
LSERAGPAAPDRWDEAYRRGTPPWDIGRPQPAVVDLADAAAFSSPVLDAGCGTGENALLLASRGLEVVGIDHSATAIARAQAKAEKAGLSGTRFVVGDAFELDRLGRRFASALDSGLYHTFEPETQVPAYLASLHAALVPDASLYLMCFSDREPGDWGPRRISRGELEAGFTDGWRLESIEPARFEIVMPGATSAQAWLVHATRLGAANAE